MKRGIFDILRRGVDNTVANWPLIAVRFVETIVFGIIAVVAAIAIIIPIAVSAGIRFASIRTPDDIAEIIPLLAQQWLLLVWILLAVSVLLLVFVLIHSYVVAGCARVLIDGERIAGEPLEGPRSRYRVFSFERWAAGGADGWWTVFWIYNLAWGVAGLLMILPMLPTLALMLLAAEEPAAMIGIGCIGLVVSAFVMLFVAFVTGMWTNRAIADWAVHRAGIGDALADGWRAIRHDVGRHLLVALAVFVVAIAGSMFFSSFSFFVALGESVAESAMFNLVTLPIRIFGWLLSSIFSAAIANWYIASYGSIALERRA